MTEKEEKKLLQTCSKEINKFIKELGYTKNSTTNYQLVNNELLIGFEFRRTGSIFLLDWFVMPLIPSCNYFKLDVGERYQFFADVNALHNDRSALNDFIGTITNVIFEFNQLMRTINSLSDLYEYFYVKNNWNKLKWVKGKSAFRNYERLIYIKAYLGLDFEKEVDNFFYCADQIRDPAPWVSGVIEGVEYIMRLKSENGYKIKEYLQIQIQKTINELKIN